LYERLRERIENRTVLTAVIGLGYVGLPLSMTFAGRGLRVIGFDVDPGKVTALSENRSYIAHVPHEELAELRGSGRVDFTTDFRRLKDADAVLMCVPTPLKPDRTPDLSFVENTTAAVAEHLRPGQLVVLESTTYPGTTREVVLPILRKSGLNPEADFFLAYSPEREDPGNRTFRTADIPRVVGAIGPRSLELAAALYSHIVPSVVKVSSPETAEAAKLLENIYRAVNIALVNEMKIILDKMNVDVHEVISAASTKPFGFQPFHPGPGWGGHCIPIDPFYLSWKARILGVEARFIEDAGWVNVQMPHFVISKAERALAETGKTLFGSAVLLIGLAYKKNVDDDRESPAYEIMELLHERGAKVSFHDPYIPAMRRTRRHPSLAAPSIALTADVLRSADCVVIVTDHDMLDKQLIASNARLIVDTRNFLADVKLGPHTRLVKA